MAGDEQVLLVSLCGYCSKNVSNNGVKCTKCTTVYHPSCAGRVKSVKVGESGIVCCASSKNKNNDGASVKEDKNKVPVVVSDSDEHLVRENLLLKQLLFSKDEVIDALREEICLLNDKISLLEEIKLLKQKNNVNMKVPYSETVKKVYQEQKIVEDKEVNKRFQGNITADSIQKALQNVNNQMLVNKQTEVMKEIVNLEGRNGSIIDKDGFQLVQRRNRKSSNDQKKTIKNKSGLNKSRFNITVGTGTTGSGDTFKSLPSKMWLFVGKVDPSVKKEEVEMYIKTKCSIANSDELVVDQLNTRTKSLSFKVGIDKKYYDSLSTGDFWPNNIAVRRYNFWSERREGPLEQIQKSSGGGFLGNTCGIVEQEA